MTYRRYYLLATPTYGSWRGMRSRCNDKNHKFFYMYGGAGVKCCDRWKKFKNFLDDMGECPDGHTLDRIDPTKGYEPSNCRWATQSQNNANRRGWSRTSQYKGVYQRPSGRYAAVMRVNGKTVTLGTFDNAEDAAKAFDAGSKKRFGEFARINFED